MVMTRLARVTDLTSRPLHSAYSGCSSLQSSQMCHFSQLWIVLSAAHWLLRYCRLLRYELNCLYPADTSWPGCQFQGGGVDAWAQCLSRHVGPEAGWLVSGCLRPNKPPSSQFHQPTCCSSEAGNLSNLHPKAVQVVTIEAADRWRPALKLDWHACTMPLKLAIPRTG